MDKVYKNIRDLASFLDLFRRKTDKPSHEERFYSTGLYPNQYSGLTSSSSGQIISKDTALRISSVWSCIRVISETIASLPISLYEKDTNDKRVTLLNNPLHTLISEQPSSLYDSALAVNKTHINSVSCTLELIPFTPKISIGNSPYCLPYNFYYVCLENLVFYQRNNNPLIHIFL